MCRGGLRPWKAWSDEGKRRSVQGNDAPDRASSAVIPASQRTSNSSACVCGNHETALNSSNKHGEKNRRERNERKEARRLILTLSSHGHTRQEHIGQTNTPPLTLDPKVPQSEDSRATSGNSYMIKLFIAYVRGEKHHRFHMELRI
ncbi:hypothetical protein WMY93_016287 [Mugilogobius chulae]|uniref:Uncharacterized protein n=1 Tax=Mugilogobius chulae TaxID=88201 RepID=A0AAW0NZN8_9GOBI